MAVSALVTTEILPADPSAVSRVAAALREGEIAALPTETVYGLAANALEPLACARIFEAKGRPLTDPLIVHLPAPEWLERLACPNDLARRLTEAFWPGPLTLVLPRRVEVPDLVTAGQSTVALRMSAHPVFTAVAVAAGIPLAAPSANRFGRISPTSAEHVAAELGGRVRLILDGGPCRHGIESTIVLVEDSSLHILRAGPITAAELAAFAPVRGRADCDVLVPGNLKSHYAPSTPLELDAEPVPSADCGLLAWKPVSASGFGQVEVLSSSGDLREVAANLYAAMRRLDVAGLSRMVALPLPEDGLGAAIMDRLRKAAARG